METQLSIKDDNINRSYFHLQRQKLFTKTLKYFALSFFVILLLILAKFLANYFIFSVNKLHQNIYNFENNGTWGKIVNFMIIPEVSIIQTQNYYDLHDLFSLITVLLIASAILFIAYKVEQNYMEYIKVNEDPLLFLFSLEISHLKDEQQAELFVKILDVIRPNQQICQDKTYIYDLKNYQNQKHKLLQSGFNQDYLDIDPNKEQELLTSSKILRYVERSDLNMNFKQYAQFSNKMIITLNDLYTIYDLLSVYHSGLLQEKVKKEKENNYHNMTDKGKEYFNKIEEQKDFFKDMKIQLAQDPDNIIWHNYSMTRKQKIRQNFWKLFGVIILSMIFFTIAFFLSYYYAKENLKVKIKEEKAFYINIGSFQYPFNAITVCLQIFNMALPVVGYIIIEHLMMNFKCATISSTNNYKFAVNTLFELICRFPASHYGYTTAIKFIKQEYNSEGEKMRQIFYLTHIEWINIIISIIFGSIAKYILDLGFHFSKKCIKKNRGLIYKLNHTIPATNLIISIAFLGFYQSLLSPFSIILVNINLWLTFAFRKIANKQSKYTLYIDFNNISVIIQLALFSYAIGGLFSFDTQYIYSHRYFVNQGQNYYTFPYFVIANIVVILILVPTLFNLTRHNSISLRILEQLIQQGTYNNQQGRLIEILKENSYSQQNPYEIEKKYMENENQDDSHLISN